MNLLISFWLHLYFSISILPSGKEKSVPLESHSEKKGQFCHDFLHCTEFRSGANANTQPIHPAPVPELALWHYLETGAKPLQALLPLNGPGLMMRERSGGQEKEKIRKKKVVFLSHISNLAAQAWTCTLLEKKTKAAPAERPSCLSWTGNISRMPSHPPPWQPFALLGRPLCWVSSIDATLPRPVSQQLSTFSLKIHPSLSTKLWGIMLNKQCTKLIEHEKQDGWLVPMFSPVVHAI